MNRFGIWLIRFQVQKTRIDINIGIWRLMSKVDIICSWFHDLRSNNFRSWTSRRMQEEDSAGKLLICKKTRISMIKTVCRVHWYFPWRMMMIILRSCYDSFYLQNLWVSSSSRLLPEYSVSAGWDVRHVELAAKSSCCSDPAWALRLQGGSVWSIFTSWTCGSNLCIYDLQPTWQTSWMSWSATSCSH